MWETLQKSSIYWPIFIRICFDVQENSLTQPFWGELFVHSLLLNCFVLQDDSMCQASGGQWEHLLSLNTQGHVCTTVIGLWFMILWVFSRDAGVHLNKFWSQLFPEIHAEWVICSLSLARGLAQSLLPAKTDKRTDIYLTLCLLTRNMKMIVLDGASGRLLLDSNNQQLQCSRIFSQHHIRQWAHTEIQDAQKYSDTVLSLLPAFALGLKPRKKNGFTRQNVWTYLNMIGFNRSDSSRAKRRTAIMSSCFQIPFQFSNWGI